MNKKASLPITRRLIKRSGAATPVLSHSEGESEYTRERYRSWRWRRRFAWRPVRTFDAGWVWLRLYWRWQCQWAWGSIDDYPYLYRHSRR